MVKFKNTIMRGLMIVQPLFSDLLSQQKDIFKFFFPTIRWFVWLLLLYYFHLEKQKLGF